MASFNVENYFPVGGQLDGGTVSQEEFDEKTARLTDAIDDRLKRPEVIAVQEVQDLATLQALAELRAAAYTAYLEEGNDYSRHRRWLSRQGGVKVEGVTQYGKTAPARKASTVPTCRGGLFDRPPLALEVTAWRFRRVHVFSNHFASKAAPDACREAQATFVRDRVAELESRRQAFHRSRGPQRLRGRVGARDTPGRHDDAGQSAGTTAPEQERYSFAFQGRLQTLDHASHNGWPEEQGR